MTDIQACTELVMRYVKAVHTQERTDFDGIFSDTVPCRLISVGNEYVGKDSIFENFLHQVIRHHYSEISLIADDLDFNQVSPDMMIIVFRYHTECIRRDSGEPYGIHGMETQVAIRENNVWRLVHVHYSKV